MGGGGMGGWLLGWLLVLLVLVAVVAGVVYLLARLGGTAGSDRAMDVLREEYARGEISDEEFEERASRLSDR